MNCRAEAMKVARLPALPTISEKIFPPAAQPPTEMKTFSPLVDDFRLVKRGYSSASKLFICEIV